MADNRRNIKVSPELFERLNEERGHQPWNEFLEARVFGETTDEPSGETDGASDFDELADELEALRDHLDDLPERTADELEHRMR